MATRIEPRKRLEGVIADHADRERQSDQRERVGRGAANARVEKLAGRKRIHAPRWRRHSHSIIDGFGKALSATRWTSE